VAEDADREQQQPGLRLDVAGRVFRPNWALFHSAKAGVRSLRYGASSTPTAGRTTAGQGPLDIICAGMYRACSTWQYEVVAHLVEHHRDGRRLGYLTPVEYARRVGRDQSQLASGPEHTRWCVVKAHEGDRSFARALLEGRARAVYVHRDVREVVFSLMHKRGKTFEQLVRQGMIHQILANDRFWMAQPDILVQRYDDILADPAGNVQKLARHLGIALEDSEADRIADEYSQESNRARAEALRRRLQQAGLDLDSAENAQICDTATLLHWNHMRQAGAGSWQTKATPAERATLHRLCERWLRARGYQLEPKPAPVAPYTPRHLSERVRSEVDIIVGRLDFLLRSSSQRFPGTARAVKHLLGIPFETKAGAMAWSDPVSSHGTAGRSGELTRLVPTDAAIESPDPSSSDSPIS
jgi:hypothetical protein